MKVLTMISLWRAYSEADSVPTRAVVIRAIAEDGVKHNSMSA
jgi:hypothetical protein